MDTSTHDDVLEYHVALTPAHLPREEESRLIVAPVTVLEVTRDDDEGDILLNGLPDEIIECLTGSRPNAFDRSAFMPGKPSQRTVEMDIGRVKKAERVQSNSAFVTDVITELVRF